MGTATPVNATHTTQLPRVTFRSVATGSFAAMLVALTFVAAFLLLPSTLSPSAVPGESRPALDLPSAHANNPTGIISFFGNDYFGDTFVWCLDRSGSMLWGGTIDILCQEVNSAILQLSDSQLFGVVSFADDISSFSPELLPGTVTNKTLATEWVLGMVPLGATCLEEAMMTALDLVNTTTGCSPVIIAVSDGVPFCNGVAANANEVLLNITAANTGNVPIYGIFLGTDVGGLTFMETLTDGYDINQESNKQRRK